MYIYIYTYKEKERERDSGRLYKEKQNSLTRLWSLRSLKMCRRQAGNPDGRADGASSYPGLKVGERWPRSEIGETRIV